MVYLVTWDLNKEGSAYDATSKRLHARLDTLTTTKHPGLDSVRFVSSDRTAESLAKYIYEGVLDGDDKLVLTRMRSGEYYGWISKEVWDWISARL